MQMQVNYLIIQLRREFNLFRYDKDQLSQLQESMNKSVRVALFG